MEFKGMQTFTYDYVFGMDVSQQELYNQTAAPLLKSFMEGYKCVDSACMHAFGVILSRPF